MKRLAISLSEYNRIYQVAHGVMNAVGGLENSSLYFAAFGSLILNKHFKIPARPVVGAFALCVDELPQVAAFGTLDGNALASDESHFHTWVQTEDNIIDFMGPIYTEAFAGQFEKPVDRKMFQRLRTEQAPATGLVHSGDFWALPNPGLTDRLLNQFLSKPKTRDLMALGEMWFGRRSSKQKATYTATNDLGTAYRFRLPANSPSSAW